MFRKNKKRKIHALTDGLESAMISFTQIEVAFFMSRFPDVAGTVEGKGKGTTPKEEIPVYQVLGMQ